MELWARIEPVLDGALELPAADREAFVRAACGDDDRLRREVDRLLRSSALAEHSVLSLSAVELGGPLLEQAGIEVLGRYELVRPLGAGGMGVVFLARDRELGRGVALKFLPPHVVADPAAIRRFRDEARAASALDHPNIAAVHDIAETRDGQPFIVMGFYEGEPLHHRIARGPLPPPDARAIAAQVADGLAAAHAAGVVHRDIKPSNILVTPDGARILDFGIAKTMGQTLTQTAATPGTVAYMSPEQTRGEVVDGRSDVWSLGVVLYEMLAGQRPFRGDNDELIRAIGEDEPAPLRRLRPAVSRALARVVERCLEKERERRFQDADSLARALRQAGSARRAAPLAAALGAVVLAATGVVALGLSTLGERLASFGDDIAAPAAAAPVRFAVLPFEVLGDSRFGYLEDGMAELLATLLDGAGPLRSVDRRSLLAFLRTADRAGPAGHAAYSDVVALAHRFNADLLVAGSVVEVGGRLRIRAALYDAAGERQAEATAGPAEEGELFDMVERLARELIGSRYAGHAGRLTRLAAATTSSMPALKAYLEGERELRGGHYERALGSFREAVNHDSTFALAWYRLAVAAEWTVRPAIADAAAERAAQLAASLPEHARLLVTGWHAYATGASGEAERIYRRILDSYPDNVEVWLQLGEVLFHYGPLDGRRLADARPPFQRALALEPGHEGAILHLARIAAREGEMLELDELVDRLLAVQPEGEIAVEARALRAFASRDAGGRQAVIEELRGLGSDAVFSAVWTVSYTRDPVAVAQLAALLTDTGRPSEVRAAGHVLLATAELARGRWRRAREELSNARRFNPAWALELGTLYAASGIVPVAAAELDSARIELEAWDATAVRPALGANAFLTAHDGVHDELKYHLLRLLELAAPRTDEAAVRDAGPDAPANGATAGPLGARLTIGYQADSLRRAGRHAEALRLLETARSRSPYSLAVASPFHASTRERLLRAALLAETGRTAEALHFFLAVGDGSVYDLPFLVPAYRGAAQLLEDVGEHGRAAELYSRVAALWQKADPELTPVVEAARLKAATLAERQ